MEQNDYKRYEVQLFYMGGSRENFQTEIGSLIHLTSV